MLRITGGELKGRRLQAPRTGVRPTTGRIREAIFSMLGPLEGLRALDLYCGTGALGIEALSRGASEAHFVDRKTATVMRNLEELGIIPGARWQATRSDVVDFLQARAIFEPGSRFDLVLCDPPYRLAAAAAYELDIRIPAVVTEGARVVLETSTRKPIPLSYPLLRERAYGDTLLRIYAPPAIPAGEVPR